MRRPRLACLVPGLGRVDRGVERVVLDLARHLRTDFDLTLFGGGTNGGDARSVWALSRDLRALAAGFSALPERLRRVVRRLHLTPVELEMLTFSLAALRPLWRERFDGHLLVTGVWGARLARILRAHRQVPFIYLGHGGYAGELPNAQQRPDLHVFVNPAVMREVQRAVPGLRAVFIPNGIDLERFAPRPSPLFPDLQRPLYLAAGAMVEDKCLDLAIRAVGALPRGSLALVGRGPEEARLRALGAALLGPRRFSLTAAPMAEMPAYYNACDVFTLPSRHEPFGLVYLEAMACGKPVVGHRDDVRELIVGQAGILCRCDDVDEYAGALADATREPRKEEPRRQAERFDIRAIAREYAEAITRVLNGQMP